MPPSVAPSQLPNDPAQAIKEPLGTIELGAFLDGCCTKSTQPSPRIQPKSLFIWNFPDRPFANRDCRLRGAALRTFAFEASRPPRIEHASRRIQTSPRIMPRSPQTDSGTTKDKSRAPRSPVRGDFGRTWNFESDYAPYSVPKVRDRAPADICNHVHNRFVNIKSGQSAACGSPPRRAYRPYRRCGRVAEGGGLLNRYRVVKPYRGFESLRLRHHRSRAIEADRQPHPIDGFLTTTPNAIVGPIHPKAIPVIPTTDGEA